MDRDKKLDHLRAFAMLWTVWIHVLYWGDFFQSTVVNTGRSWLLIEMPLLFFVAGASNALSKQRQYFRFVLKRWRRILIPYWGFSVICIGVTLIDYASKQMLSWELTGEVILSWLIPLNRQITELPYLTWALWFIPVYLCIVLFLPALKNSATSRWRVAVGIVMLLCYLVTVLLESDILQKITFYGIFTYLGHFYCDIERKLSEKRMRTFLWTVLGSCTAVLLLLMYAGADMDLQFRKFPPDPVFLIFSFAALSAVLLALTMLDDGMTRLENVRLFHKIIDIFAKRTITIFLYQVFVFMITAPVLNMLIPGGSFGIGFCKSVLCLCLSVLGCAGAAKLFGGIESLTLKK